jgi:hypothetical protein
MATGAFAQATWQTTHTTIGGYDRGNCELMSAALKVTVHPAWLDVEEDLEIAAVGAVAPGNDAKSLEIIGNFSLPTGAAITGALLWDGDQILQAVLLDKAKADSAYQVLVDRNSTPPPRPRDPILLEMISKGNYRLHIYPVQISNSRHVRLRYQLPPAINEEGIAMTLNAALATLAPNSQLSIPVTFTGAGVDSVILALSDQSRSTLSLPRTRLMRASDVAQWIWGYYGYAAAGIRLIPVDHRRQVAVGTSMAAGLMAGHYLNLYAGVSDDVLGALGRKVEIVVFWKWHAPASWALENGYGYADYGNVYTAQAQAGALLNLYGQLGGTGNQVGLLHDDGRGEPKRFGVASRGDAEYQAALEYLGNVQGNYVMDFALGMKPKVKPKPGDQKAAILASESRFYQNMRLVKSLYSPATGVVRHLVLVSAGPENVTDATEANAYFDSLFADKPLSVGTLAGSSFAQAGFDAWTAHRDHPAQGPQVATEFGSLPGFDALNLNLVVRNSEKAYDFPIRCEGGLALACGSLTFHGKSDHPWQDSLEWEAFDAAGKRIGTAKTLPKRVGAPEDTSIAVLWAGSESPFSENRKEPPLGPVYGFVDAWASMIGLPKDTLKNADVFADTGVPRVAPGQLTDVLPNYQPGDAPTTSLAADAARLGRFGDPAQWIWERTHAGLSVRIPGFAAGVAVVAELFDMQGKRVGFGSTRSESGAFFLPAPDLRSGLYILKVRAGGVQMAKRIVF